jgi:hypothetical protein
MSTSFSGCVTSRGLSIAAGPFFHKFLVIFKKYPPAVRTFGNASDTVVQAEIATSRTNNFFRETIVIIGEVGFRREFGGE